MKVLVTGAAGFIGFHLCRALVARGDEVVGIDSINDYYDPDLKRARLAELGIGGRAADSGRPVQSATVPSLSFCRLSLEDTVGMEGLFAEKRFDRVCHLAAQESATASRIPAPTSRQTSSVS